MKLTREEPRQIMALEALNKIRDIIAASVRYGAPPDYGAMSTSSGYLLFLLNYAKVFNDESMEEKAYELLDHLLSRKKVYREEIPGTISFCSGVLGTAWVLLHARNRDFIDFDDDILDDLDPVAMNFIEHTMKKGNYDFLHGAGGGIYYLMQKRKTPATLQLLKKAVQLLLDQSIIRDGCQYWESYDVLEERKDANVINLGLSHGMPSIIAILSKLYVWDPEFYFLGDVIRRVVAAVRFGRNDENAGSIYPYAKNIQLAASDTSRIAWCYGDMGIAVSLWQAGEAMDEDDFRQEAVFLLEQISARSTEDTSVNDGALCHGTAGSSHILRTYAAICGSREMSKAADFWLEKTLEYLHPVEGLLTARAKWDAQKGYVNCFSLLEGLSGIGLALLSAYSPERLHWDETLIISL
ncbi:lanthionine synthetase LanC family protein [Chitinophaga sp. 22536]|uniref:lanthionine synthetase LanC family protein n=1 Tax=unclassified Chitinophaga TaxID=2619133 RepID=UPI003F839ED4